MTSYCNPVPGTGLYQARQHAREGSNTGNRARPHRMPAGGWIQEIAPSENWRTTTIVRRHRDSVTTPGST
jgi:hypothetical protein